MGKQFLLVLKLTFVAVCTRQEPTRREIFDIWSSVPRMLNDSIVVWALAGVQNKTIVNAFMNFVHHANETFVHEKAISFLQDGESAAANDSRDDSSDEDSIEYADATGNPHCDIGMDGPKTVRRVIPGAAFAKSPLSMLSFDMTKMTTDLLNGAQSSSAASSASSGVVGMVGMMMVKNMIQTAVSTGVAIVPPSIPPPVWNLMPLPCVPMITGQYCFGAVLYPITFADAISADVPDAAMAGVIRKFRSVFLARAGIQPDAVYQKCFKAYMSLMCSSIFPMCTNPQGRNEMIPFIGRVPTCFTACLAVLMYCPGFGMAEIAAQCTEISIPPICSQALFQRPDPDGARELENLLADKLNSKCSNYDPEVDAGEDPYLYEEDPPESTFKGSTDMQSFFP